MEELLLFVYLIILFHLLFFKVKIYIEKIKQILEIQ